MYGEGISDGIEGNRTQIAERIHREAYEGPPEPIADTGGFEPPAALPPRIPPKTEKEA